MEEHPLSMIQRLDPKLMAQLTEAHGLVFCEGAMPKKYKLLMAMAFDAAHGAQGGVRALAQRAMTEGATSEEIVEALRVAWHLSGVGSLYTASLALKDVI
jgi:alkylhydroperoxidase/carboxymuconolactone decarboxylase family protein YurZ